MPVTINGNGSITGLSVGGLGAGVVNTALHCIMQVQLQKLKDAVSQTVTTDNFYYKCIIYYSATVI